MNTFSKYSNDLLHKMGVKSSSTDASITLPIKKAKFVKRFDMKVTTLQSHRLLRRDTPSPSCSGSETSRTSSSTKRNKKGGIIHFNERKEAAALVTSDDGVFNHLPIDPNNVVASIHRNLALSKHKEKNVVNSHHRESRDDYHVFERNEDARDEDLEEDEDREDIFVLDDDCDSIDSVCTDCVRATCTLSVDDIYAEDELLGLAFVRD